MQTEFVCEGQDGTESYKGKDNWFGQGTLDRFIMCPGYDLTLFDFCCMVRSSAETSISSAGPVSCGSPPVS